MLVLVLKHKKISGLLLVFMLDQFIKCLCLCLSIFRCACPIPCCYSSEYMNNVLVIEKIGYAYIFVFLFYSFKFLVYCLRETILFSPINTQKNNAQHCNVKEKGSYLRRATTRKRNPNMKNPMLLQILLKALETRIRINNNHIKHTLYIYTHIQEYILHALMRTVLPEYSQSVATQ